MSLVNIPICLLISLHDQLMFFPSFTGFHLYLSIVYLTARSPYEKGRISEKKSMFVEDVTLLHTPFIPEFILLKAVICCLCLRLYCSTLFCRFSCYSMSQVALYPSPPKYLCTPRRTNHSFDFVSHAGRCSCLRR